MGFNQHTEVSAVESSTSSHEKPRFQPSSITFNSDDIQQMLEDADKVEREVEEAVIGTCQSTIQELARNIKDHSALVSPYPYMYSNIIDLQLVTFKGKLQAIENSGLPKRELHPATDEKSFDLGFPYYQVSDITVLAELYASVNKVSINGQILCGKLTRISEHDSIYGEVRALHEIQSPHVESICFSNTVMDSWRQAFLDVNKFA